MLKAIIFLKIFLKNLFKIFKKYSNSFVLEKNPLTNIIVVHGGSFKNNKIFSVF